MGDELENKIDAAKKDLTQKKAPKKKVAAAPAKKGPVKKVAAKKVEPKKATAKKTDNEVTIADLAAEAKLPASKIRRLLRATMKQDGGAKQHWKFAPGSSNLKAARQAIGLN